MKAVIFDFDGTLTKRNGNLWKKIWKDLGYDVGPNSYYVSLYKSFINGKITHKQWCQLTCYAFQKKGFNKDRFDEIISEISLMNGAERLIKTLHEQGKELFIVSGNVNYAIKKVLGSNNEYISDIKANDFNFDESGNLVSITGTKYDFEGKATFVKELCNERGYSPSDILFIGNSDNDEWVYTSGARTLCVNPDKTKSENKTIWNNVVCTDDLSGLVEKI